MKMIRYVVAVCFLLSTVLILACISTIDADKNESDDFVQGEILVKFKEDISQEKIKEINEKMGASVIRIIKIASKNIYLLKIPEDSKTKEIIRQYNELPEVEYAEPNYRIKAL